MLIMIFDIKRFFILAAGLLFCCSSYAWNELGHLVIANIAYQQLQPAVREKVDSIAADLSKEYPVISNFVRMAPWPDTLRNQKINSYTHWHYIDIPFSTDGTPIKNIIDTDNVLWAINQIIPVVQNQHANTYERARFLAFLIHFVGDVHQPLHAVSRISSTHPYGDQGGNLFLIKSPYDSNQSIPLHKLWDSSFDNDTDTSSEHIAELTREIISAYPVDSFGNKATDLVTQDWADENSEIAKTFVYSTEENKIPSENYMATKKQISEQRIALAGYRLANLLNQLLGSNIKINQNPSLHSKTNIINKIIIKTKFLVANI
jgi:hypothetical protein